MQWFDRMVAVRDELGITSAEVARRAGLQEDRVRKYAHSKVVNPRGNVLRQIAQALGVHYLWLRDGTGPKFLGENGDDSADAGRAIVEAQADFGRRMRDAREALGFSHSRACAGLAITEDRWRSIETGTEAPNLVELIAISERLRESLDWLVGGMVAAASQPPKEDRTLTHLLHERAPPFVERFPGDRKK